MLHLRDREAISSDGQAQPEACDASERKANTTHSTMNSIHETIHISHVLINALSISLRPPIMQAMVV